MLAKGCIGYLDSIADMTLKPKLEWKDVSVARDVPEVFLEDLLGLSPNWEIELIIKLLPGIVLISKAPYHIALV